MPDRRRLPARPDLAAHHLRGEVSAARFVEGRTFHVAAACADLRAHPSRTAPLDSQLIYGAAFEVYEEKDGWSWGQAAADGYVGYVASGALEQGCLSATHIVSARSALVYEAPDAKAQAVMALDMNARIEALAEDKNFIRMREGWLARACLRRAAESGGDYVCAAEAMYGAPYLWGGRTSSGMDCSGLVQAALEQMGRRGVPRDSDQQEAELGRALTPDEDLQRGDLVFWRAHVGIMRDSDVMLHANAHHMCTASESLAGALPRLRRAAGPITSRRRP